MKLNEFDKIGIYEKYMSKERFWFENDKVKFWYKLMLNCHTYQDSVFSGNTTKYQVFLVVDDESVHSRYKDYHFKEVEHGFLLKQVKKRGDFDKEKLEKILNSALKTKIENKIKVDKYQKIKGILEGTDYYI